MGEMDSCSLATRLLRRRWFGACNGYRRVVLQLVEAAIRNDISRVDAFHLRESVVSCSRLDVVQMSNVILNNIHKRSLAILLNGRRRNQGHTFQGLHQQPRINELVWEQSEIVITKNRAHLHRSRGGVNLVIQSQQLAARDFLLCSAVKDVDGQLGVLAKLGLNRTEAVLRDREDHRDRLYLCDD